MRAGQPCAVASDGMSIHTSTSTPSTPTAAPATRSQSGSGLGVGDDAVHERADARARRAWPTVATSDEEQHRDRHAVVGGGRRRTR